MKLKVRNALVKMSSLAASVAMLLALTSVSSTCIFMSYQPDVPEELLK